MERGGVEPGGAPAVAVELVTAAELLGRDARCEALLEAQLGPLLPLALAPLALARLLRLLLAPPLRLLLLLGEREHQAVGALGPSERGAAPVAAHRLTHLHAEELPHDVLGSHLARRRRWWTRGDQGDAGVLFRARSCSQARQRSRPRTRL